MKAFLVIMSLLFVTGCISVPDGEPLIDEPPQQELDELPQQDNDNLLFCETAADCVAEQCCHATSSVNFFNAPNCEEIVCSLECVPDTLDCGQGTIECIDNACTVILF